MDNADYNWPEWTQLVDTDAAPASARELLAHAEMLKLDNRSLSKKMQAKLCIDRSTEFALRAEIYEFDNGVTVVTHSDLLNPGDFVYLFHNQLFQRYRVATVRKGLRKTDPQGLQVIRLEASLGF
jgi:hypothetical protein